MHSIKYHFLFYFIFGFSIILFSQNIDGQERIDSTEYIRTQNFIGFIPSKATKINGWAIGNFNFDNQINSDVNGIYSNINPIQLWVGVYAVLYVPWMIGGNMETLYFGKNKSVYSEIDNSSIIFDNDKGMDVINGISVNIIEESDYLITNGIEVSLLSFVTYKNNGISISGLINKKTKFNGVMIGLVNHANKGNGLQLGLINNCGECRGIQIGLINRCGKRILPFINFRL